MFLTRWPGLKNFFLDLLFPRVCLGCGVEGAFLCFACENSLSLIPPQCFVCKKLVPGADKVPPGRTCPACQKNSFIYAFISPLAYDTTLVRALVHGLKYDRLRPLAESLARILLSSCIYFRISLPEAIAIPVPLHPKRLRTRGFNQSEEIAKHLAILLARENQRFGFEAGILKRVKNTTPQVELSGQDRRQNMAGGFAVSNPELVRGKTVFLIDDVKTTGATLEEAARVLKEAGAKKVWAMTVAH